MEDLQATFLERVRERAYALWHEAGEPADSGDRYWHDAEREIHVEEAKYDKVVADSFPASDPPANSGVTSS